MQWWENGPDEQQALGTDCNYTVIREFARNRMWKVRQDRDTTLLKATWHGSEAEAKAQAEAWESNWNGDVCTDARNRRGL